MLRNQIPSFLLSLFLLAACQSGTGGESAKYAEEKARAPFEAAVSLGVINDPRLDEISGITASIRYPGYYWVHNDSGGEPSLYLIDSTAKLVAEIRLQGVTNRDWEDIASCMDSTGNGRLFVGEIGDNRGVYGNYSIHVVPEPGLDLAGSQAMMTVADFKTLHYTYPDGARDAETLLVDPSTLDLFIISKRERNIAVYHWPFEEQGPDFYTLKKVGAIPFTKFVAGDISGNGQELLLKDYESVFYWKKDSLQPWKESIHPRPHRLPYQPEPQGEAIAFTIQGDGYVTISEQDGGTSAHLYFYRRKPVK